jgi:hypothetical protein
MHIMGEPLPPFFEVGAPKLGDAEEEEAAKALEEAGDGESRAAEAEGD